MLLAAGYFRHFRSVLQLGVVVGVIVLYGVHRAIPFLERPVAEVVGVLEAIGFAVKHGLTVLADEDHILVVVQFVAGDDIHFLVAVRTHRCADLREILVGDLFPCPTERALPRSDAGRLCGFQTCFPSSSVWTSPACVSGTIHSFGTRTALPLYQSFGMLFLSGQKVWVAFNVLPTPSVSAVSIPAEDFRFLRVVQAE